MAALDVQTLFRQNHLSLVRFLRRRGLSAAEAADTAQDAFMRLLLSDASAQVDNWRAYLFATARNLSVNHQRRQAIAPFTDLPDDVVAKVADRTPSPEQVVAWRQELAIVRAVFAELEPQQQRIFYLTRIEGCTFAEAGRRLGLPLGTVYGTLTRILVRMQLRLDATGPRP